MLGAEGRDHRDRADHRTPTPEHPWRDQSGDREPAPKEPAPAIPPRQPLLPDPLDLIGVPAYSSKVASYAVVGIVAPHHRSQMDVLVRDRLMPVAPTPRRNRRQRSGVTILCRSGRIVARTGLRMMPTFPRSPLTFRKASFPRYG